MEMIKEFRRLPLHDLIRYLYRCGMKNGELSEDYNYSCSMISKITKTERDNDKNYSRTVSRDE